MSHQSDTPSAKDTSIIPEGSYCYSLTGARKTTTVDGKDVSYPERVICPYWSSRTDKDREESGFCLFMESGDADAPGISLLWDHVKECRVNEGDDNQ